MCSLNGSFDLLYAATIFAYGQTSSGKTYTMRGITESAVNDIYKHIQNVNFIIPLYLLQICTFICNPIGCSGAINWCLKLIITSCFFGLQNPERDFVIKISALEIYNEVVHDLLNPDSGPLRLLDDPEVLFSLKF